MRLTSLIILLALVGGGIYVVFYTDLLKKGQEAIQGYHDAKTPQEAMDLFRKAIQSRKYDTAARYVTNAYGVHFDHGQRPDEFGREPVIGVADGAEVDYAKIAFEGGG